MQPKSSPPTVNPAAVERRLDALEHRLRELQIRYQRFLNGDTSRDERDRSVEELREEVAHELRALQNLQIRRSVDGFRLANLEARFNTYREMFGRRVRDIEEGRVDAIRGGEPAARRFDVDAGVVVRSGGEAAPVEALFQGLVARGSSASMDLDTFRRYLDRQIDQIRAKTGCGQVQFRVAVEEGKVKLKAKPVQD